MTTTDQPDRSLAPGIIPEPPHLNDTLAWPPAASIKPHERKPRRRNPARIALDRVMSALHGDRYMVDAYPAAGPEGSVRSDDAGSRTHQG
jgi:hypothetical protein